MAGDEELPSFDDWDDEWPLFLPPPPPPPSIGSVCTAEELCEVEGGPMGAHFDEASFPTFPVAAVCSSVTVVAVLVIIFLLWRHKKKVQNLLPCKEQQGHIGELGAANGITYEDVLINRHPTRIPQGHLTGSQTLMPLEILDVMLGDMTAPPQLSSLHHTPCYPSRDVAGHMMGGRPFNPVYEEVTQATSRDKPTPRKSYDTDFEDSGKLGGRSVISEDNFGEDLVEYPSREGSGQCSATSSVLGSTGGDLCKDAVSSDEGNGEDCDYPIDDMPSDSSFSYPQQPMHLGMNRPEKPKRNTTMHAPRGHQHNTTYPLPERTANFMPSSHRMADQPPGHKVHSKPDSKRHVPPSTFAAPRNHVPNPTSAQWYSGQDRNYPASASQENIYSTIDEDELPEYPVAQPLPSLACSQRGSPSDKLGSVVHKSIPGRSERAIPPLSQRKAAEEKGDSYGDMMPVFHSASFM